MPILYNLSQRIELPNSYYEANMIPKSKPDRHYKKTTDQCLLGAYTQKASTKVANQIQQSLKRIIYHNQVGFILGMQSWFAL